MRKIDLTSFRARIEEATGLPAALDNAANACALAELWFGRHPDHVRNLTAVTVSEGIAVGLLLNGQLIHGGGAMAGEFGHLTLDEDGPPCPCGKRAAGSLTRRTPRRCSTTRTRPRHPIARWRALWAFCSTCAEGDPAAAQSLDRMAKFLGIGLAGLVTGLNPDVSVIIGDVTSVWDRVGPIVASVIERRSLAHFSTRIVTTYAALQPRLRDAATLVIQQPFCAPNIA